MPGDTSRVEVAQALAEQFGTPISAALIEVIPPFGWHEIATRDDLSRLEQKMDARFDAVDARFAAIDSRFAAIDSRFDALETKFEARFDKIDARFLGIDARFAAVEARFLGVDARFDSLESNLSAALRAETTRLVRWMVGALIATVATGAALVSAAAALQ